MPVNISSIAQIIEKIAPKYWAEEWDNVGLLVGSGNSQVNRILMTLDGTLDVIDEAKEYGSQLIIAHHPIIFRPLKNLRFDNSAAQVPLRLLEYGIGYYAAHTNLDQSELSSSRTIGEGLGLEQLQLLAPTVQDALVKLVVFVPDTAVNKVREALSAAGVGAGVTDGDQSSCYSECFFQSEGEGMFRPLPGANPAIGKIGELARVKEIRLESILPEKLMDRAIRALRKAHPYEEPAYDLIPLHNKGKSRGYGIIGRFSQPQPLEKVWEKLIDLFKGQSWKNYLEMNKNGHNIAEGFNDFAGIRLAGDLKKPIRKVAIANGSGSSFVTKALFQGVDLFITGDVDHHVVLDCLENGMNVVDLGHFLSEIPMVYKLADYLKTQKPLQDLEIIISAKNKVPWMY